MMDTPISAVKPNEIESIFASEITEIDILNYQIRQLLEKSRSEPNRGVHCTLIREFATLSQMVSKLGMIKNELEYFYRHNTVEIPYGDE